MSSAVIVKFVIDLVAVLLLALGIKGLSKVRSARAANQLAAVAMAAIPPRITMPRASRIHWAQST